MSDPRLAVPLDAVGAPADHNDDEFGGLDPLGPSAVGLSRLREHAGVSEGIHDSPPESARGPASSSDLLAAAAAASPDHISVPPSFDLQPQPSAPGHSAAADAWMSDLERCNLYVSNLSTEVTDDELRAVFAPYGNITNSRVMVDIHTLRSRGFGFVQFTAPAEAAAAVKALDASVHRGQTLMVRLASRKTRQPGALMPKVFLRNVPAGVSEDDLRRLCAHFGLVTTCAVRPDTQHGLVTDAATGGVSQVAYVTFTTLEHAKKAAVGLNNSKPWATSPHPLLAKVLDDNQKRREQGTPSSAMRSSPSINASDARYMPSTGGSMARSPGIAPVMPSPHTMTSGGMPPQQQQQQQQQQPLQQQQPQQMPSVSPLSTPVPYPAHQQSPFGLAPAPQAGFQPPPGYQVVLQPTLQPIMGSPGLAPMPTSGMLQGMPNVAPLPHPGGAPLPPGGPPMLPGPAPLAPGLIPTSNLPLQPPLHMAGPQPVPQQQSPAFVPMTNAPPTTTIGPPPVVFNPTGTTAPPPFAGGPPGMPGPTGGPPPMVRPPGP